MQTTQRRTESGVIKALLQHPYRFEFFQAVRLLEQAYAKAGVRSGVVGELVRFRNSLLLSFPPSEIEALKAIEAAADQAEPGPVRSADLRHVTYELTPTFIGLTGPVGALPRHYTEQLIEREALFRDRAARVFLDIFSNRMVAFFYQAWKKYRLHFLYEQDRKNLFTPLMLSLVGCDHARLRADLQLGNRDIYDESIAHYAGIARHRPASASNVQRMLEDHFGVRVRFEQFVGRWFSIPADQRTTLSGAYAELGVTSFCGERTWQRQTKIRILLGPMTRQEFMSFLPYGDAARALSKMLALTLGQSFEFEVRLVLKKEEIFSASLGSENQPARLGWDTFLLSQAASNDSTDAMYEVEATAA
jgi:type VI secretion system protein ImpH